MEYLEGKTLSSLIEKQPASPKQSMEIACQLCEALAEVHKQGIIHRDLKPANIVLDNNQRPRLLDFGIAAVSDKTDLTKPGTTQGTIAYMSPEQIEGKELDSRSDLFSLGVVLYELVTGVSPFKKENQAATINAIINADPEPAGIHSQDIPECLSGVIESLLEKDRENRSADALTVKSDLTNCLNSLSLQLDSTDEKQLKSSIAVLPFANLSADAEQ